MIHLLNRRMAHRLATAEAQRDAALEAARIANERTVLLSITRDKRKARLLFARNGELTQVEAYVTLDADWDEIERRLMGHG